MPELALVCVACLAPEEVQEAANKSAELLFLSGGRHVFFANKVVLESN
jgi:hypothetical protein